MIQEVNKNPQLHSFDPSDLRCLGSDFTRIQMDQDLQNAFPEIFSWR